MPSGRIMLCKAKAVEYGETSYDSIGLSLFVSRQTTNGST